MVNRKEDSFIAGYENSQFKLEYEIEIYKNGVDASKIVFSLDWNIRELKSHHGEVCRKYFAKDKEGLKKLDADFILNFEKSKELYEKLEKTIDDSFDDVITKNLVKYQNIISEVEWQYDSLVKERDTTIVRMLGIKLFLENK